MKRYYIDMDQNYHGPELLVEEATEGEWVKFEDVKQEIKNLNRIILSQRKRMGILIGEEEE